MRKRALIAAVIAAVTASAALLAGCAADPAAAPTATPAATPTETTTLLTDLVVGECYEPAGQSVVLVVDCADAHSYEVFASLLLEGDSYPADSLAQTATDRCDTAFSAFVGLEYDSSELTLRYIAPSESTWEQGDREVLCIIADPEGRTSGSLAGALR